LVGCDARILRRSELLDRVAVVQVSVLGAHRVLDEQKVTQAGELPEREQYDDARAEGANA
jgi:hypothetical protein